MGVIEVVATIILMMLLAIAVLHLLKGDFTAWAIGKFKAEAV